MKATEASKIAKEARDKSFDLEIIRIQSLIEEQATKGCTTVTFKVDKSIDNRIKNYLTDLGYFVWYKDTALLTVSWS